MQCNYETVKAGRLTKYVFDDNCHIQYATANGVTYVQCDVPNCTGRGKIEGHTFYPTRSHANHIENSLLLDEEYPTVARSMHERASNCDKFKQANCDGPFDVRLKHPSTMVISGPTNCGKTRFVFRLLDNLEKMFSAVPEKVLYCYGEYQEIFDNYPWIQFNEGLPDLETFNGTPTLLILDDLMSETNDDVTKLFTKVSHHRSVTVIYLTQNIFYQNKQNRTISLNSHYMVLFKSVRSTSQIAALAAQMYSKGSKYMIEAFDDATKDPHSYLLVDMRPETDERLRLRAKIFPGEIQVVYVRK